MKKLGRDTFNKRLKQTMFENSESKTSCSKTDWSKASWSKAGWSEARQSQKHTLKNNLKVKAASIEKWLKPRKMRKVEKFALASLLTYAVYMMQMAQHF